MSQYPPPPPPPPPAAAGPPPKSRANPLVYVAIVGGGLVALLVIGIVALIVFRSGEDEAGDDAPTFADAEAAVDAFENASIECEDFTEQSASAGILGAAAATSSGTCTLDESLVRIDVYDSADDREKTVGALRALFSDCDALGDAAPNEDNSFSLIVGRNWIASATGGDGEDDQVNALRISTAVDAELVALTCRED